jgi:hypothetical protein
MILSMGLEASTIGSHNYSFTEHETMCFRGKSIGNFNEDMFDSCFVCMGCALGVSWGDGVQSS